MRAFLGVLALKMGEKGVLCCCVMAKWQTRSNKVTIESCCRLLILVRLVPCPVERLRERTYFLTHSSGDCRHLNYNCCNACLTLLDIVSRLFVVTIVERLLATGPIIHS